MATFSQTRSRQLALVLTLLVAAVVVVWAVSTADAADPGAFGVGEGLPVAGPWDANAPWAPGVVGGWGQAGSGSIAWGAPNGSSAQSGGGPGPLLGAPAPDIAAGSTALHGDRGACTACHRVLTSFGAPVPILRSTSPQTHEYRGVCTNCHRLSATGATSLVAGVNTQPTQPREAEWRGIEVVSSPQGVLVAGVEGTAATAGVQTGDVVLSINGIQVRDLAAFGDVTQNGRLPQGTMIATRAGQRLAFELAAAAPAAVGGGAPAGGPQFTSPGALAAPAPPAAGF